MPRRYKENKGEQQQVIEETPTTTTEAHLLPVKEPEQEPEACDAHSPLSLSRLEEVPEGRHNRPHNHHHHHRLFLAALAVVQNALVGGVLFGWNSVDRTLLAAPLINGGAGLSSTETTTVFSAASATAFVSALLLGLVLDHFGPRACSIVAHLAVALGFQLVAHATSHYKRYLLGFCLIAAGGPGIQASVVHVSNLYGSVRYAVLSGLTGSMTLSFLVLPLLEWMWHRYDVSLTTSFATYGLVVALSGMASYLCWPDHSFPSPTLHPPSQQPTNHPSSLWDRDDVEPTPEDEYVEAVAGHSCPTRTTDDEPLFPALPQVPLLHPRRRESDNGSENVPPVNRKDQSFAQQLCSAPYMRSVLFLAIACFWANLYVASLSTELADASSGAYDDNDDDDDDSAEQLRQRLSRRLTYILSSNCLVSFGVGYFMDHFGQPACAFVTLLWGQLHMVLILLANHNGSHNINDPTLLTLGFVAYGMFRQFLFPAFVAGLTHNLGFKYFGLLSGLAFAFSGAVQLLVAPLVGAVQGDCHLSQLPATTPTSSQLPDDSPVHIANDVLPCFAGHWTMLHVVQFLMLGALWLAPWCDYIEDRKRHGHQRHVWTAVPGSVYDGDDDDDDRASPSSYGSMMSAASTTEEPHLHLELES